MNKSHSQRGMQWLKLVATPLFIIALTGSVIMNVHLYSNNKEMSREINITWNNAISEFYAQANKATLHAEHLEDTNLDLIDRKVSNLDLIIQQLENLQHLPYAKEITPYAERHKIKVFINYHQQVLKLAQKDLAQDEVISSKNIDRLKAINQGWEVLVRKLNTGENSVDPFNETFDSNVWRKVWIDALTAFDQVELLPLPEENE